MSGRRGRSLSTVASGLVECGPTAVYLWLLRTRRMANPDPAIHTQSRFGGLLGRDGTFVSHVEAGRRTIPHDLHDRWRYVSRGWLPLWTECTAHRSRIPWPTGSSVR
jgi:hypothetical protein